MTPLEKFNIAARLGKPDQVPVTPFATGHFISKFAGIPEKEYWWDPVQKFNAQVKLHDEFPGVMFYPGIWPDFTIVTECSPFCEIYWPEDASPQIKKHITDVHAIEPPDPRKDGFMLKMLETYRYMQDHLPVSLREYEYLDGFATTLGPTDIAGLIMGYPTFLETIYTNPDDIHVLMKVTTETAIRSLKAQEQVGGRLKRFIVFDDIIGFISPKHFREFSLPYIKIIFQTFPYAIGIFHCDANTTHLLEDILDIGMNIFNFGPEMDIKNIKEKIGNQVCLLGNMMSLPLKDSPPSRTLKEAQPEEVEETCRELIEAGMVGGGYILSTGSGIAGGTPNKNIWTMIHSAEKFGKY